MRISAEPCVLLDAMTIIKTHELGVWTALINARDLAVPEIVADEAYFYFDPDDGSRTPIELTPHIDSGKIKKHSALAPDIGALMANFDRLILADLHPGELEALTILGSQDCSEYQLCTSDKAALQAAAMIGYSERCVSLEEILDGVGLRKPLEDQYTKSFCDRWLSAGRTKAIQGEGLV